MPSFIAPAQGYKVSVPESVGLFENILRVQGSDNDPSVSLVFSLYFGENITVLFCKLYICDATPFYLCIYAVVPHL